MKVSVIVPIYKVEPFIKRCAESLMGQTLLDVEYIFVNDATPDNSMKVLNTVLSKFPHRMGHVKIVSHDVNKGLPAARNTGLREAKGEYIYHCDSDDYVELDALETLYNVAVVHHADIVWCDWLLTFSSHERYMKQPKYDTAEEALVGMLSGSMKYNVWNKLVKRQLYDENGIQFPTGYGMGEDMTMLMLFIDAKNVVYVPRAFYHYVRYNENAFSNTYSQKHLQELQYNTQRLCSYIKEKIGKRLDMELEFFKLEVKFPFLISDKKSMHALWRDWFPESNKYIYRNKNLSFRRRFLQIMASYDQWWFINLYYQIFYGNIASTFYKR